MKFESISNRDKLIEYVIDTQNGRDNVVEVGADLGEYFKQFKTAMNNEFTAFLIDTWSPYHFYTPITVEEMEERYLSVISYCVNNPMFVPLKGEGVKLSRCFPDKSIGFCYIDAKHDYESVREDISAWLPKVMEGGILAGHDFHMPDVANAVKDTLDGYTVHSTYEEEARTWYTKI